MASSTTENRCRGGAQAEQRRGRASEAGAGGTECRVSLRRRPSPGRATHWLQSGLSATTSCRLVGKPSGSEHVATAATGYANQYNTGFQPQQTGFPANYSNVLLGQPGAFDPYGQQQQTQPQQFQQQQTLQPSGFNPYAPQTPSTYTPELN